MISSEKKLDEDDDANDVELILHSAHSFYDGRLRCNICGSKQSIVLDNLFMMPVHQSDQSLPLVVVACRDCHSVRMFLAT